MIHDFLIRECRLPPDDVALALKGWDLVPVMSRGEKIGEVMVRGCEVHIAVGNRWRCTYRAGRAIIDLVRQGLAEKVFLITRLPTGDPMAGFVERLGFKFNYSLNGIDFFWLDEASIRR